MKSYEENMPLKNQENSELISIDGIINNQEQEIKNRNKKQLKKSLKKLVITAALSAGLAGIIACGKTEKEYEDPYIKYANSVLQAMIATDNLYQPDIETSLEQQYGVNILINPSDISEAVLEEVSEHLAFFSPQNLAGLNIALGVDPLGNASGRYFPVTAFGPAIFIKAEGESFNDGQVIIMNLDGRTIDHEISHHIHFSLPNKDEFDNQWYSVMTSIPFNGQMINVTKWEALQMLKREGIDLWEIDNSGQIVLSSHGLFGFISPYGAGSTEPRITINNIEDVGTYGGNIETEIKDNLLR
ncbi:hypothetical protein KY308_00130, partial [Candidatus Woesearchaeota archaeon]|nr:hypothetical protein [Candidatus Woesearchaeota archaeon]